MDNADHTFRYIPYSETGYFSRLVTDYLSNNENIRRFYNYRPDAAGIAAAIAERALYPVNREVLVSTLRKQYESLTMTDATSENISLLLQENTFTICTAHQPNLLTGYLYFVYKILHAIKLAEELNTQYPDKHFVPVYYMGSEDNDIEELGTFRFRGEKYVWDGDGQTGAVGRMNTAGLKKMLGELFKWFGPPGKDCEALQNTITQAYLKHKTVGAATQYLVNELFGKYGLIVLDPDDAALKALYVPVMKDELLQHKAIDIISAQIGSLGAHYKIQAQPREINLFYLNEQLRERIEQQGEKWVVLNTEISWTKDEILQELNEHPERFSPNVMLRGLFQETILPDVAFIGGGAEVAYWMQLKTAFAHYKVFYPAILLRQSVMWVNKQEQDLWEKLGLDTQAIFKPTDDLIRYYIAAHTNGEWQTRDEMTALAVIIDQLKQKATALDPTLEQAAGSVLAKVQHQVANLELKMMRAEKRKMEIPVQRIRRFKTSLFPNGGLQERVDNFMEYYLDNGIAFFDTIKKGIKPLDNQFLIIS
jgi:bacillithiol biosynthesis cysteine-adding enzyme BshC